MNQPSMRSGFTLLALALVALSGLTASGCASQDDPTLGISGMENRRPFSPNLTGVPVSSVNYTQSTRTVMVEGKSPFIGNTYLITPEQRAAIEQIQANRELQEELNW